MATPIFSFNWSVNQQTYFFRWNTFSDLPHTIPMDIVTFLNYHREDKEFLQVFHECFPKLIATGSTLKEVSFADVSTSVKEYLYTLVAELYDGVESIPINTCNEIIDLFVEQRTFDGFNEQLEFAFQGIPTWLPRPDEYYDSLHHLFVKLFDNAFDIKTHLTQLLTIEKNSDNQIVVPEFIFELLHQNAIPLNTVPHVYRKNSKVEHIFRLYGAESLLPQVSVLSNFNAEQTFAWQKFEMKGSLLRRFHELCIHSDYGIADDIRAGLPNRVAPVHELSDEALYELNFFSSPYGVLYNYCNAQGMCKLPWKYLFASQYDDLTFLAEFHHNALVAFETHTGRKASDQNFSEVMQRDGSFLEVNSSEHYGNAMIWQYDKELHDIRFIRKSNGISQFSSDYTNNVKLVGDQNRFFYRSGWFNLEGKPISPLCFTSASSFSEGRSAVCIGGKWGYLNEDCNLVIPPVYGHALPFISGFAKVFVLEAPFQGERGEWVTLPIEIDLAEEEIFSTGKDDFILKFNGYGKSYRMPLLVLTNKAWLKNNIELHYFGDATGEKLNRQIGRYVVIDKEGSIVFENLQGYDFSLGKDGAIEIIETQEDAEEQASSLLNSVELSVLTDGAIDKESLKIMLIKRQLKIAEIPDYLLANSNLMLEMVLEKIIDYSDLPLNYKLKDEFIQAHLKNFPNNTFEVTITRRDSYPLQSVINTVDLPEIPPAPEMDGDELPF
jgi:hypothetical protein